MFGESVGADEAGVRKPGLLYERSTDIVSTTAMRTVVGSTIPSLVGGRRGPRLVVMAAVAAAGLAVLTIGNAAAEPKPTVAAVQAQLTSLQQQAEAASEQYNATTTQLASVQVRVKAASTRAQQQKVIVEAARRSLGRLAVQVYKVGDLHALSMLLDDNPGNRLAVDGLISSLSDRQAQAVQRVVGERRTLDADLADLTTQQQQLGTANTRLAALKKEVTAKIAAANALLTRLTGAEREALARASSSMDTSALKSLGVTVPSSGSLSCGDVGIDAPDPRAAAAIKYACAQLGKPYVWGAAGPNSFDCSGLTLQAWARGGVTLDHFAETQLSQGSRVSLDSLLAGDLVFFHSPIGHVGIYIGKGLMIHAPHTGDVVRIAPARLAQAVAAARY
jgi:peptidoglycan DL-endopeptidase CwlO